MSSLSSDTPSDSGNIQNDAVPRARIMHSVSCTENLGARRGELVRLQNRRDRIQECVLGKMRLGLSYDEAWDSVKREHQGWFLGE